MKGNFKTLLADTIVKTAIIITIIFILAQAVLTLLIYSKLPPLVPFLNSQPWGAERLFPSWSVLTITPVMILVFFLNTFLGMYYYKKNTLVARILSFNSLLFTLLSFLAFIQIFFLVF